MAKSQRTETFPFPVEEWRALALPPAEAAAWVELLTRAWASDDCTIPGEDDALARLTGLAWETSMLRSNMNRWFAPLPSGRLVCTVLEAFKAKVLSLAKMNAAKGNRSGAARRAKRTTVQRTTVQNEPRFNEPRFPHKPRFNTAGQELAQPIAGQDAEPKQGPPSSTADREATAIIPSARFSTPPNPPNRECSFKEEGFKRARTLSGGVQGGEKVDGPIDLLGGPILDIGPRSVKSGVRVTQRQAEATERVLAAYVSQVQSSHRTNKRAFTAVARLICKGTAEDVLLRAVRKYADDCTNLGTPPEFRMGAPRFFARDTEAWRGHLEETAVAVKPAGVSCLASFAERVTKLAKGAPEWYGQWAYLHATFFEFTRPDDDRQVASWWRTFAKDAFTEAELEAASLWMTDQADITSKHFSRPKHRTTLLAKVKAERAKLRALPAAAAGSPADESWAPETVKNMQELKARLREQYLGQRMP